MNKLILKAGAQNIINNFLDTDIVSFVLKKPFLAEVSNQELAQQIEAKKKCQNKLPTWFKTPKVYYPARLNIEQSSSERTAKYKATLVQGESFLDITCGYGVDAYYLSKRFSKGILCEKQENLAEIVRYNFKNFGIHNITLLNEDGIDYLQNTGNRFDWIYADPGRRHEQKGKVFKLSDCQPNIPLYLELLFSKSERILLKTSPLLDLSMGTRELKWVQEIHVVAINNEVKELLWVLGRNDTRPLTIHCYILSNTGEFNYQFSPEEEKSMVSQYDAPLKYLYEPNSAILKAGAFKSIGKHYNLQKLHQHTHLYTSNNRIAFPGRVFRIDQVLPFHKKIAKDLDLSAANISTRNFPESVASLRKKTKIKDGGNKYLFFTTDLNNRLVVIICSKI